MCRMILRFTGQQRSVEREKFVGGEESFGLDDRDDGLVESGEAAIPVALFMAKRHGQSLQAAHGGHFLDAVDEQGGASATQHKDQRRGGRMQAEVHGGIDHVERIFAAMDAVLNLGKIGMRDFLCGANEAIHAAHFLNGGGRDSEELAAYAKQNYLLGADGRGFVMSGEE